MRIARIQDTGDTQNPLHPAEIRLFKASGLQYSSSELAITMSSSHPDHPPGYCLDGDVDTFCHSADTDSNAWLNVAYVCTNGLSKVQVVSRRYCCQHTILQYRMHVIAADGITDLHSPFTFVATQMEYNVALVGECQAVAAKSQRRDYCQTLSQATGKAHGAAMPSFFQPTVHHTSPGTKAIASASAPVGALGLFAIAHLVCKQRCKLPNAASCCCTLSRLAGACFVRIERIQDTSDTQNPLHTAEVRLFKASGVQYSCSELSITMSSSHPDLPPENCLDGDTDAFCHSADTDSNAWLLVQYPCNIELSQVQVVNRRYCCQHTIMQYRMRVLCSDGATDLKFPFTFSSELMQYSVPYVGKC